MDYQSHRPSIKSGDLLAWSNKKWKTWHDIKIQLVRIFLQTEYSHVGTALVMGGRVWVLEAVEPRSRIYPLSKLGSFYHIPLPANWTPEVEEKALSYIGEEYKQLHAIKAFFKPLEKEDVSECAALAIAIADKCGLDLGVRATPDEVVEQAQRYGGPTYYIEQESK